MRASLIKGFDIYIYITIVVIVDFYTIKASKGFLYYMKDSIIKRIRVRALYKFLRGFEGFGGFRGL